MSYGRPPGVESFSGKPPALGSFPLDHEGECKDFMKEYIKCLRANKNNNGACREFSRAYLQCRMDNGLMAQDDMKNLGYQDASKQPASGEPKT
ncbi:hypothetical protein K450DRAFT_240243 [Umbelopsis ramanniana AG]|uniref:Cytochrome c oxidase assembly protein COX19 n=1 Tax=Umbelopsis ramanniana AG TaxID=1314678 RepID=A0AAD5HD44_UMBRA|nr:uncharacterized protein K450DRAFT_240243 [Umbelopsis ramanniana AG]KAI8579767.1 hypothetical protein K450DRAFT_240243 [Umbelopsis ramanniana AG]